MDFVATGGGGGQGQGSAEVGKLQKEQGFRGHGREGSAHIVQLKACLLGIGSMVWRRILAPTCTALSGPHGVLRIGMEWAP